MIRTLAAKYSIFRDRSKVSDALLKIWDEFHSADCNHTHQEMNMCKARLQDVTKDPEVLSPLMKIFPHLRLEKGTLDCLVEGNMWGACGHLGLSVDGEFGPLSVKLDGSEESVLERVYLHYLEDQFFLAWHANYGRTELVTSVRQLQKGEHLEYEWKNLDKSVQQELLSADYEVRVTLGDKVSTVSYCIFSPFGGLYRVTNIVNMQTGEVDSPEELRQHLVEYNCGIAY